MSFDLGVELETSEVHYKLWPTTGSMVALIDADLLPYMVGYTVPEFDHFQALKLVEDGYFKELKDTPQVQESINRVDSMINSWVTGAMCDSALLFVTDSSSNFRLDVAIQQEYKGKRVSKKPAFYAEIRDHLINKHNARVAVGVEADDLIVMQLYDEQLSLGADGIGVGTPTHRRFASKVAISRDKDLRMQAGWHYDPYRGSRFWVDVLGELLPKYKDFEVTDYEEWPLLKGVAVKPCTSGVEFDRYKRGVKAGEVKTKKVKVGMKKAPRIVDLKGTGLKFFYAQLLMGDAVDCYGGCKGVGATGAYEALDNCKTEEELYAAVLARYKEVYGETCTIHNYRGGKRIGTPEQLLTEQGRLAYMQRYHGDTWNKNIELPLGTERSAWL